ncbi:MAG: SDR family oxidoreductase [Chloroflexi bacterium]|nr:SDR family oxidoreductase [Chloroflexota bacterium]
MKLLIFGATGGTGRLLVEQALAQGHVVTAFVRDSRKLTLSHPQLRVVPGNVLEAATVDPVVADQDAVLVALGSGQNEPLTVRSDGTRHITRAMQQQGVKRIIVVLSAGVVLKEIAPQYAVIAAEHRRVFEVLQQSGLDWIAVCPPSLTLDPATGGIRAVVGGMPENGFQLARADMAAFMLKQLTSDQYLQQAVGVAN